MSALGIDVSPRRTVLITGVAGYIGSHAALAFLDAGWHVIGVDDLSTGSRSAVPQGVEFIEKDCASAALQETLAGRQISAAVHLAGLIRVDQSFSLPAAYYDANFCVLGRLLNTLASIGVGAVIFSSTAAVYGDQDGLPVTEDARTSPTSPYGRSKLAAEWLLNDLAAATSMRHAVLRYFNVAGGDPAGRAGPRSDAMHLIKIVAEAAAGRRAGVTIHGSDYDTPDGTCVRDYIHVSDLASAHVAAVEYLLTGGESTTLNCGYGRGFSVREVVDHALELSDHKFNVVVGPRRPGDSVVVVADTTKLRACLAWTPKFDKLDTILRTAIAWERKARHPIAPVALRADETRAEIERQLL